MGDAGCLLSSNGENGLAINFELDSCIHFNPIALHKITSVLSGASIRIVHAFISRAQIDSTLLIFSNYVRDFFSRIEIKFVPTLIPLFSYMFWLEFCSYTKIVHKHFEVQDIWSILIVVRCHVLLHR